MTVTPRHVFLADDDGLGDGQTDDLMVSLTYEEFPPAVLYSEGLRRSNGIAVFESLNEAAAIVGGEGEVEAVAPGSSPVNITYTEGDISLSDQIVVEVVSGADPDGQIVMTFDSPTLPFDTELRILVRGPRDAIAFHRLGNIFTMDAPPGLYELEAANDDTIDVRTEVVVRPGSTVAVDRTIVEHTSCVLIDDFTGGDITLSDGAVLSIPAFALDDETEICAAALPGAAMPWRGPLEIQPFLLPTAYTFSGVGLLANAQVATLTIPVDSDLVDDLSDDELATWFVDGTTWLTGGRATVDSEADEVVLTLPVLGGVVAINGCLGTGTELGRCRVRQAPCSSEETRFFDSTTVCGAVAVLAPGDVTLDAELELGTTGYGDAIAATLSVASSRSEFASCSANPCPFGGGGCTNCDATASLYSCGVVHNGSVERYGDDTETPAWEGFNYQLFVPQGTSCEASFGECAAGGDVCPDDIEASCEATCAWSPSGG